MRNNNPLETNRTFAPLGARALIILWKPTIIDSNDGNVTVLQYIQPTPMDGNQQESPRRLKKRCKVINIMIIIDDMTWMQTWMCTPWTGGAQVKTVSLIFVALAMVNIFLSYVLLFIFVTSTVFSMYLSWHIRPWVLEAGQIQKICCHGRLPLPLPSPCFLISHFFFCFWFCISI